MTTNNKDEFEKQFKNITDFESYNYSYYYDDNDNNSSSSYPNNCFCDNCGIIFYINAVSGIYKIKDKIVNLVLCENCYCQIYKEHKKRVQNGKESKVEKG